MTADRLTLHVDGAARGNPGPAGVAAILTDEAGREILAVKDYIGEATNNTAEYRALLLGLAQAAGRARKLDVFSDSELLVRQVNGEYKVKNAALKELMSGVARLMARFESVRVEHVPRDRNERADEEANAAIDEFLAGDREPSDEAAPGQERLFDV